MVAVVGAIAVEVAGQGAVAQSSLYLAYPPPDHQTTADRIFLIGSASPDGTVTLNGEPIKRSPAGYFAPSFPLQMGKNRLILRHENQTLELTVTRLSTQPAIPDRAAFAPNSLQPSSAIARLPDEEICFSAIAPPTARVFVAIAGQSLPLFPVVRAVDLPPNAALLNAQNQPSPAPTGQHRGCTRFSQAGTLGTPQFLVQFGGQSNRQDSGATLEILDPDRLPAVEVTANEGIARTGAGTDYSRLTPLPQGTIARVTGKEGDWLRLDYGAWIRASEVRTLPPGQLTRSIIRSIRSRQIAGATEILFPLQVPVPLSVRQGDRSFTLTLYNTIAQTDTIALNDDPLIRRLDWHQILPDTIQYVFQLKTDRQWGYSLRYEGTTLILTLRHPPQLEGRDLQGVSILLDPGHGGSELGSRGPTGYPEKELNLVVSKLLSQELERRGARVYLTRDRDVELSLGDRVGQIDRFQPTLALSIHYNALPDGGDAENTQGVSAFWYQPQAHSLAVFLENHLTQSLNRPSYGVFWNNLALTRPTIAPSVLLELGFTINPDEFEWATDPRSQRQLAQSLAQGISDWFRQSRTGDLQTPSSDRF